MAQWEHVAQCKSHVLQRSQDTIVLLYQLLLFLSLRRNFKMYTIIEDCSPYYIRFSAPEHQQVVDHCLNIVSNSKFTKDFTNHTITVIESKPLIKAIPLFDQLKLNKLRLTLFVTQPGVKRLPHKDGQNMQFGINYMVEILDDKCITNWYTDESLSQFEQWEGSRPDGDVMGKKRNLRLRGLVNFDSTNIVPAKSMVAKAGEAMLFNVNMYHDWNNEASSNRRIILTLRPPSYSELDFQQVSKILFPL